MLFIRYVAFDPLGHKLITGISNAPHNQTQWDRVAAPACQGSRLASTSHVDTPRPPMFPPDRERRMAVCYRSLVEQYEQLVQRYYNLSQSRTPTVSMHSCTQQHVGYKRSSFCICVPDVLPVISLKCIQTPWSGILLEELIFISKEVLHFLWSVMVHFHVHSSLTLAKNLSKSYSCIIFCNMLALVSVNCQLLPKSQFGTLISL